MLMQEKKGLIMGVANDRSIAWGIAKCLAQNGAKIALTYQGEALKKRVEPLAQSINSDILIPCDVTDSASMENVFKILEKKWGKIDFLVHGIGFQIKMSLEENITTHLQKILIKQCAFLVIHLLKHVDCLNH